MITLIAKPKRILSERYRVNFEAVASNTPRVRVYFYTTDTLYKVGSKMKLDKQKTSEDLLKMRAVLERDIEANTEDWSELVKELIPSNQKQEWKEWFYKNKKNY
ncbi:hypothetical protein WKH14_19895 [Pantoea agglomerans]|uniref:hypothetical protein n=1 Tax=Enterobacter agglomerans TaxID=549 RepID=UPI003C7EA547